MVLDQFDLSSIRFDWVPGGTETAWEYIITLAGDPAPLPTDSGWNPTTTHPVTALFLPSGTAFDFYVRAICTPGVDESTVAGPVTGNTTICPAAEQCNYTFTLNDSFGDGWNGATMQVRQNGIVVGTIGTTFTGGLGPIVETVPLCTGVPFDLFWNNAGNFPGEVRVAISNPFAQTIFAITTSSAALANTVLYTGTPDCVHPACLPPNTLTASNITAHEADLTWIQNGTATPASWEIYAVVAGSPAPTPATVGTIVASAGVPPYHITGLLADTDYVFYVRALCDGASTPTSEWSVVSTIFHTLPTCPKPTGLLVSNPDMTSLQFSWIAGGSETAWEYLYLPAGSPAPTAASTGWIPSTTTIVTVNGLTSATAYDFYVRGICTPSIDISTISGPATGNTTICAAVAQCNFIFTLVDSFGDGWNGATMQVRQNGIVVATLGTTFTAGAGPIVVTVPICPDIPMDLFWNNAGNFPAEVRISVSNNFNQTLYSLNTSNAALAGTVLYSLAAPSCTVPVCQTPIALSASPFTYNASLTWNFIPGVTYDVYVVPAGSPAPTAGSIPTYPGVTTNPFLTDVTGINAFLPQHDYTFYVRMVCDSGPTAWSTGSNFTTLPTCPQPQNLSAETTTTDANITFTEVGPATSWEVWVLPAGSPAPAAGTGTIFNQTPVGGIVTINTLAPAPNGLGMTLFPGLYNFYVRSICSPTDASAPITGPLAFFILNVDPICASVIPSNPLLDADGNINLCPDNACLDITATYTDNKDTSSYIVESIPFSPPFPFDGGTQLDISIDDIWGPVFTLPFNFCFFGTNYPTVQVGSNGVLSFGSNFPPNVQGGCPWNTDPTVTVPNPAFPILNALYGVYQDINPSVPTDPVVHTINYQVLGTAPCRTFVLNFVNIAQYSCGTSVGLQTSQMVLYETSNNMEVYVKDRTSCTTWNDGSGVIGIQNSNGTIGYTPPGRNLGPWETHNEAWRFKPDGASNVVFSWLDQNGNLLTHDTTLANYCVSQNTTVTAQAVYNGCGGVVTTKSSEVHINVGGVVIPPVSDVTTCQCYTLPHLTVGHYYPQPNGQGIEIPEGTVICQNQTVYIFAQLTSGTTTCSDEKSFTITIAPITAPTLPNVTVCQNYTLPNLNNPDYNYYTDTGGLGTMYPGTGGDVITATTTIYIYGNINGCEAESNFVVTVDGSAPTIPTFDPIADICLGATAPLLPSTSTNGIQGTWSPPTIDTATPGNTCYTFTPNPDQLCTAPATLCVNISNQILPTFASIANICQNASAPILPTTSLNGVTGTWSPAINTGVTGPQVITFTPDTGQSCAIATTITVTVDPSVTATFAPIADLCKNSVAPALPLTSDNGVTGTWSPATIDTSATGSMVYTFTPDVSQPCSLGTTITINVIEPLQPNFVPITICYLNPAPILETTSPNGITGTWSPLTINNTLSGDYIFTPDAGQCAVAQTIHVTINAQIAPNFAPIASFCAGTTAPLLLTTSPNNIPGTWNPSTIDNQQSGCYLFTPNAGLCSEPQQLCVTVTPRVTPDFAEIGTICPEGNVPTLATTSPNGVPGTWNPQVISNTSGTTTYVFTPDAGQCANSQTLTVNVVTLPEIEFQTGCVSNNYLIQLSNPVEGATYSWAHNQQAINGTNTPSINLTQLNTGAGTYTVNINIGGCTSNEDITILNVSCDIQKGISPKGNGTGDNLNDSFDLTGQNVGKLEIFNRYGTKVYSKANYSNEWYGQTDKGDELPDGTYYYMIEYTSGSAAKTGWIYINREQ